MIDATVRRCVGDGVAGSSEVVVELDVGGAVCRYIEEPERLAAARAEARRIGAQLAWPSVAEATASVLHEAVELAPRRRRSVSGIDQRLVSMRTDHLLTLVDDVGIVQHANGVIPNRAHPGNPDCNQPAASVEVNDFGHETGTSAWRRAASVVLATTKRARDLQVKGALANPAGDARSHSSLSRNEGVGSSSLPVGFVGR